MPIRITGLNSGLDTESIISALVSSYNYKTQKYEKAQTKLSWKQDAWKELNTKIYSLYTSVGNLRFSKAYNLKSASVSDSTKVSVTASSGAVNGTYSIQVTSLAKAGYLTGAKLSKDKKDENGNVVTDTEGNPVKEGATSATTLSELGYTGEGSITIGGKSITVKGDTKISEVISGLKDAGVNANFDEKNGRIYVSAKNAGVNNDFTLGGDNAALEVLGLVVDPNDTSGNGATRIIGSDATIYVNNAKYTNDSNSFSINGLTINALSVTTTEEAMQNALASGIEAPGGVSTTVSADTQGIYDKIKDFLTQYNALINEMASLYNADSSSGYEPLTDEERDAMSETEVEKWEAKIKDSLLRRDDTLSSIMNTMTNTMAKGIEVNGKTLYLSSFGIKTLGYLNAPKNEHYAYHIDGDEDDVNTSGNADKLMSALASDPDSVVEYMQKLAQNLYSAVDAKMKSTSLSSVYTVYNDKEMASEYSDYTSLIRKWKERLEEQQDYYYEKFGAMESALAKLNSQTTSMSGFFG